jgi:Family of unknown function (DUF6527)
MTALRIIDPPDLGAGTDSIEVGDMWRWERADRDGREAWAVMLPGRRIWWTTDHAAGGGGWEATGEPPAITVTPSIWVSPPDGWHGWIRDGQLVDA